MIYQKVNIVFVVHALVNPPKQTIVVPADNIHNIVYILYMYYQPVIVCVCVLPNGISYDKHTTNNNRIRIIVLINVSENINHEIMLC